MNLNDKVEGSSYTSAEWNEFKNEIQNFITSSGLSLVNNSLQLKQAVTRFVSNASSYSDSGIANAYALTAKGTNETVSAYIDGMIVYFIAGNNNTGASTLSVAGLAAKSIKKSGFTADVAADDIVAGSIYIAYYSLSDDAFEIASFGGGGAAGGASSTEDFTQASHGFIKYDAIYFNGTNWVKAQADTEANAATVGIVSEVQDVNNFTVTYSGLIEWGGAAAYTLGNDIWLSPSVSGGITDTEPTYSIGEVRQFVGTSLENGLLVNIDIGEVIGSTAPSSFGFPVASSDSNKTAAYTIVSGDVASNIVFSGLSANVDCTLDVSLLGDDGIGVINEDPTYSVRVIVSNTGTMTIATGTSLYLWEQETVLLGGNTATNARILARP